MSNFIDVDTAALHRVAARVEAAAKLIGSGATLLTDRQLEATGDLAAAELHGTAARWLAYLRHLHDAVAGTGVALHEVADGYAAAHAEAVRQFDPGRAR